VLHGKIKILEAQITAVMQELRHFAYFTTSSVTRTVSTHCDFMKVSLLYPPSERSERRDIL